MAYKQRNVSNETCFFIPLTKYILAPDRITFPGNDTSTLLDFVPYNNIPMGVDHFRGQLFITMPRRRPGIPSTLNYIDINSNTRNQSPLLKPFPDIMTNSLHVSVS